MTTGLLTALNVVAAAIAAAPGLPSSVPILPAEPPVADANGLAVWFAPTETGLIEDDLGGAGAIQAVHEATVILLLSAQGPDASRFQTLSNALDLLAGVLDPDPTFAGALHDFVIGKSTFEISEDERGGDPWTTCAIECVVTYPSSSRLA